MKWKKNAIKTFENVINIDEISEKKISVYWNEKLWMRSLEYIYFFNIVTFSFLCLMYFHWNIFNECHFVKCGTALDLVFKIDNIVTTKKSICMRCYFFFLISLHNVCIVHWFCCWFNLSAKWNLFYRHCRFHFINKYYPTLATVTLYIHG